MSAPLILGSCSTKAPRSCGILVRAIGAFCVGDAGESTTMVDWVNAWDFDSWGPTWGSVDAFSSYAAGAFCQPTDTYPSTDSDPAPGGAGCGEWSSSHPGVGIINTPCIGAGYLSGYGCNDDTDLTASQPAVYQRMQIWFPSPTPFCILAAAIASWTPPAGDPNVFLNYFIAGCQTSTPSPASCGDGTIVELVVPPASYTDGSAEWINIIYELFPNYTLAQVTEGFSGTFPDGKFSSGYNAGLACTPSYDGDPEDPFDDAP